MYTVDLVTEEEIICKVKKLKSNSISIFQQGRFKLHKWHSNKTMLEINDPCNTTEQNFAKQQIGTMANEKKY